MGRKLVVRVVSGSSLGVECRLQPGDRMVVGRARDVRLSIADPSLSRRHLEIEWDGVLGWLRDLGSANGTFVNGSRVTEAALRAGDRIELGESVLQIGIEEEARPTPEPDTSPRAAARGSASKSAPASAALTPPPPPQAVSSPPREISSSAPSAVPTEIYENVSPVESVAPSPPPARGTPAHALVELLDATPEMHLYAIVDGAIAVERALAARIQGHKLYTLFSGDLAKHVAHAGPILIPVTERLPFLSGWAETLGTNAGVLLETPAELDRLYSHLRQIFVVKSEDGPESFLRFYDPRVLRGFLPTRTWEERVKFFGPVKRWIAENEKGKEFEPVRLEPPEGTA